MQGEREVTLPPAPPAPLQRQQIGVEAGKIIFNDVTRWSCFLMERNCTEIYTLQSFTHISDKHWGSDKSRKAGSSVFSAACWVTPHPELCW